MTTVRPAPPRATWNRTTVWHFVRHYLEMVVAMVLGMVVLGPLEKLVLDAAGGSWLLDSWLLNRPEVVTLIMATNMTIAMVGWMRYRGHGWAANLEMAAAMYLPFIVLFPPLWLGLLSHGGLMLVGHVLMLGAMAAAMLWRPAEYAGHQHHERRAGS